MFKSQSQYNVGIILAILIIISVKMNVVYAIGMDDCGGFSSVNNPYDCCDNNDDHDYEDNEDGNCVWWAWKMMKDKWGYEAPGWGCPTGCDGRDEDKQRPWLDMAENIEDLLVVRVGEDNGQDDEGPWIGSIFVSNKDPKNGHVGYIYNIDNNIVYTTEMACGWREQYTNEENNYESYTINEQEEQFLGFISTGVGLFPDGNDRWHGDISLKIYEAYMRNGGYENLGFPADHHGGDRWVGPYDFTFAEKSSKRVYVQDFYHNEKGYFTIVYRLNDDKAYLMQGCLGYLWWEYQRFLGAPQSDEREVTNEYPENISDEIRKKYEIVQKFETGEMYWDANEGHVFVKCDLGDCKQENYEDHAAEMCIPNNSQSTATYEDKTVKVKSSYQRCSDYTFPDSWVSVSNGINISPTTVTLGEDFTINFMLEEQFGQSKTFEKIAVAILNPDGTHAFDFETWDNVTVPGGGTWAQTATNYLYDTRPPGSYKAVVRGKLPDGEWFDFDTVGTGVNPKEFDATEEGGGELPDLIVRDLYIEDHETAFYPGEDITIYTRVKNIGEADVDVDQDIRIEYFLSDGSKIDSDPEYIGHDDISSDHLGAGEDDGESYHTKAPDEFGTYNITVEADTEEIVEEEHTSNNDYEPPHVFKVVGPDLIVSDLHIENNKQAFKFGDTINLYASFQNIGLGNCNDNVQIEYSVYAGNSQSTNPLVVQTDIITRDLLSPGINLQKKYSINVPDSFGKYTIAAKIDTKNEATEENESNNECDQPCRFYVVSPDRDELCALFKTTQGSDWTNKNNWDTFQSISQWYGVSTDDNRRVIGISLSDNGLDGTIPTEIGELEYLQEIVLANNDLTGEIPLELLSLSNLVRLDLSENSFSNGIPSEIGQLESLEYLDLTNSVNSSQVPSSIQFLGELIHLNLSDNSISGSFPDEICQLSNLEYLNMNSHNLTGELPDCFSSLSKLEYFYAVPMFTPFLGKGYSEGLSGMIPSNIGNLVNVKEISLQHNSFQGSLPQQIGELKSITKLDLSYNDISGVLPSSIGKLKNIKELYLQHNGIEGEIPESISNLTKLELLNIAANKLSGKIPALLGGLNELRVVNLFDNMLEGSVPKQIGMLELLEEIDLRDNELNGTLPVEIGNLENLKHIYLQDNKISGSIPESIGQLQALEELFLQNNELSNHIPTSIGNLKSLISLNVNNNNLNGKIPLEIGELINMEDIDMSNNELSGELPTELFGLKKLVYLRLGHNTLSGQIPLNINGLDEVYEIDLQDNELIGQIPPEISELSQLTHLYLSNNVLSGEVPSDIYSLNLCDFDIRNNYIEKLPKKLAESRSFMFCTGDKYYGFDVSNNYLQFDSFESNLDCFINQDCGSHYVGSYSPQRSIQVDPNEYVLKNGQIIEIAIGVGGEHNQYQWFKDDESITSVSADPAYTKKASISDSGTYICHITNTVVPDLTLYTEDITVTVQSIDQDNDGLTDQIENGSCTNATDADTDDDGILDGDEDANHNGIVDPGETDPCNPDTDGDGIQDGTEIGLTNDDLGEDTDADIFVPAPDPGITTDPNNADTDNDGYSDGEEKSNASDPNNPNTIPCPGNSGPMNVNTSNGDISAKGQTCSNSACGEEPGLDFLYGLLKFKITDLDTTQAETVEVTITYPDPIPEGSKFYKCDPESGQWLDVTQYMSFTPGDTTAVMTVTDNQFPDVNDDLGVIEDPFGPAQAGNSEESGEPLAVPTVSQWGMIVMALLLALAGVWIVGRRHGRI